MRRSLALAILLPTLVVASPAWGQGNPSGTGLPSQSCQQQTGSPGQASTSPGAPFNEPTSTSPGGTGGQNYSPTSQYDVACYQVSNPPGH
ncbi:MAG TPA: hypothetical protein VGA71_14460 [Actinomycetota bacterium]